MDEANNSDSYMSYAASPKSANIDEEAKVSMLERCEMKCLSPVYRDNVHCVVGHEQTVTLFLHNSG